jgi:hypothetical protein
MGAEEVIVASGIASVQAIEEILEGKGEKKSGKPSALVIVDEYGSFLSRILSKGQTGNVAEIPSTLQTLWGWPPQLEWEGSIKVGKDVVKVYGPAFAIFGTSTPKSYFTALKSKQVSGGFVNRHLMVNAGRGAEELVEPKRDWLSIPDWLKAALKEVAGPPAPFDNRPMRDGLHVVKDFHYIEWGAGAKKKWLDHANMMRVLPTEEQREVWIRASEMALRLATIVAAFRGSELVEVEDLDWAIAIAEHSTCQLEQGLSRHMLEEYERADLLDYVRQRWAQRGRMTRGQVYKLCERKTGDRRKIDDVIYTLEEMGEIVRLDDGGGPGRPTTAWEWQE